MLQPGKMPVFSRTIFGQKPSREDFEKLVELIRSANRLLIETPETQLAVDYDSQGQPDKTEAI